MVALRPAADLCQCFEMMPLTPQNYQIYYYYTANENGSHNIALFRSTVISLKGSPWWPKRATCAEDITFTYVVSFLILLHSLRRSQQGII